MIISGDDPVSKGAQRFEVFTGAGNRRDWPTQLKASIVAECAAGIESVRAVARRHGLDPSQIYAWRKDLRQQFDDRVLTSRVLTSSAASIQTPAFVPAVIEPAPARVPSHNRARRRSPSSAVELEINGVAVKISRGADAGVIGAVIEALRATR